MKIRILIVLQAICNVVIAQQKTIAYAEIKPAEWVIPNNDTVKYSFGEYMGAKAFLMNRHIGDYKKATVIYPKDVNITDGSVEFDVAWIGKQGGTLAWLFALKTSTITKLFTSSPNIRAPLAPCNTCPKKKPNLIGGIMKMPNTRQKPPCRCTGGST